MTLAIGVMEYSMRKCCKSAELMMTPALNPLDSKGNYSAASNNTKLVHWPLVGGLLHLVRRGGDWAD